ncbi:thermonuclease family protein [Dyadobacter sp. CY312]|uniref:thermonuclease family protein n=1 Tax=Dyadobacter sp. CY312 TaxID=2907303 RepID=UPI001F3AAAAC|nr:thermonuclease family protein [Dyadobacter sp. CY312]MCE7041933.1 thermonuclease family protein [Dyadobacter sp. CY312]
MQITSVSTYRVLTNYLSAVLLILFLSSFQQDRTSQPIPKSDVLPAIIKAEVIGIQDGDTIELKFIFAGKKAGRRKDMPLRIRLLHVNAPERGRPYYKVAKQFTSEKCFRKKVQIRHAGNFDRYGRLLGEVVLPDGKILNKELVKVGYAVHFKKYSGSSEYSNLEIQAQKKKIGIWSFDQVNLGKL